MISFYIYNIMFGIVFAVSLLIGLISTKKLAGIRFVVAPLVTVFLNVILGILLYIVLSFIFPEVFGSILGIEGPALLRDYIGDMVFTTFAQSVWAVILLVWWDNRRKSSSV